jgi:predicted Zn-dependent protease
MPVCGALFLLVLFALPEDYLADALKALDAHQPAVAEPLLRKAIEGDPKDYAAHFNLALALSLQQKDAEAIPELRKTLELKPGLYEANLNLGILLLRDKMPTEALPVLKEAAEAKPNEARPNLYYAQALLDSGDAAQAEVRYTAAVTADPKSSAAQLGLARALLQQEKLAEAADHFRAAGFKDGLLEVASQYEKSGRKSEAMSIYQEFPENAAVHRPHHREPAGTSRRLQTGERYSEDAGTIAACSHRRPRQSRRPHGVRPQPAR